MQVQTIKEHPYRQRIRKVGEIYDAETRHVPILKTMKLVSTDITTTALSDTPRELEADQKRQPKGKRRRYKRRDMEAES